MERARAGEGGAAPRPRAHRRRALALALLGGLTGTAAGCADGEPAPAAPETALAPPFAAPPSTAGAARCAECHRTLVDTWSRSGMARTLGPVAEGELDGLGEVEDAPSGYRYRFVRDPGGGHAVLETHRDHPDHALGASVAFAIGSGERDRAFAVRHGSGLWFGPLEVLSTGAGRRAVLAPGHSMRSGQRFDVPITGECLGCHTDAPPPAAFPLNTVPAPEEWRPRGIGCAACHGNAEAHARWREAQVSGAAHAARDPILPMASLGRFELLSVCAACHLQGDARLVLEPGRLGPPEPGGDLLERRALFVAAEPTNEVGFVSQVERLALSACFRQSTMTCVTCHDPHRTLHAAPERARVRAACGQCHRGAQGQGEGAGTAPDCARPMEAPVGTTSAGDCVTCHMPLAGTFDVASVRIHDHHIRVDGSDAPPASSGDDLRFAESPEGHWRRFTWPGVAPPAHVEDPGLWLMAYAGQGHGERATELLDAAPGSAARGLPMFHHVRAGLLEASGRVEEAEAAYRTALELDPTLAPSAINLGLLLGRAGRVSEGMRWLSGVLERHPGAVGALRNRAVLSLGRGDPEGFARDLEAAFRRVPDAKLAATLAGYYAGRGDPGAARRWEALARGLDPVAGGR